MTPLFGADSMLFIYSFEAHPDFGAPALRILKAAEAGHCRLVASTLTLLEVLVKPKKTGNHTLCQRYRDYFHSLPNLELRPTTLDVVEVASDLRAQRQIRTPDAIHLATAMTAGARSFLSEDTRLKNIPSIEVLSLVEGLHALGA